MEGCDELSESQSEEKDEPIPRYKTWEFESTGDLKQQMVDRLADWPIEQHRDRKLLYGTLYRNGYKLFDEKTEYE